MSEPPLLRAQRLRGHHALPVAVRLIGSVAADRRRAVVTPASVVQPGDRLRFAEPAAGNVCFLGSLEAEVVTVEADTALLVFPFSEPVLSEMIALLAPPAPATSSPSDK